jgi:hypothetical protein
MSVCTTFQSNQRSFLQPVRFISGGGSSSRAGEESAELCGDFVFDDWLRCLRLLLDAHAGVPSPSEWSSSSCFEAAGDSNRAGVRSTFSGVDMPGARGRQSWDCEDDMALLDVGTTLVRRSASALRRRFENLA